MALAASWPAGGTPSGTAASATQATESKLHATLGMDLIQEEARELTNITSKAILYDHFFRSCGVSMDISAAQFKAECLKLMDEVEKTREPIIITKHGRPVAQLAPIPADTDSLFGYMKGTMRIDADVTAPLDIEWSALTGDEDHLYRDTKRPAKPARKK